LDHRRLGIGITPMYSC